LSKPSSDSTFNSDVAKFYESSLVPLIFEPYAVDLAVRACALAPSAVLEVACGTGVVTRALASKLPIDCNIVATDLNDAMLSHAQHVGTERVVTWQQADVMNLPFDDNSFDVVVCQFSAMFFPDRVHAYREIRRVLRAGGRFLFNIWNDIESNEFADAVTTGVNTLCPENPALFLARTPYGHGSPDEIRTDLAAAGFNTPIVVQRDERSRAIDSQTVDIAFCHGTPLRNEIEERLPGQLDHATRVATESLRDRFGDREIDGRISAFIVEAAAEHRHGRAGRTS
jgi:SAM-dependent methyltransferase